MSRNLFLNVAEKNLLIRLLFAEKIFFSVTKSEFFIQSSKICFCKLNFRKNFFFVKKSVFFFHSLETFLVNIAPITFWEKLFFCQGIKTFFDYLKTSLANKALI